MGSVDHNQLEQICLNLKGTTIDIKWGNDLCYWIGDKMYCVASLEQPLNVSMKVQAEEFSELTDRDGIIPAPYTAKHNWILVEKTNAMTATEWRHYIQESYKMIFVKLPKKVREKYPDLPKKSWVLQDSNL
jgi:predicted DNA-binding protein (MmcQ/YjbR family)